MVYPIRMLEWKFYYWWVIPISQANCNNESHKKRILYILFSILCMVNIGEILYLTVCTWNTFHMVCLSSFEERITKKYIWNTVFCKLHWKFLSSGFKGFKVFKTFIISFTKVVWNLLNLLCFALSVHCPRQHMFAPTHFYKRFSIALPFLEVLTQNSRLFWSVAFWHLLSWFHSRTFGLWQLFPKI